MITIEIDENHLAIAAAAGRNALSALVALNSGWSDRVANASRDLPLYIGQMSGVLNECMAAAKKAAEAPGTPV